MSRSTYLTRVAMQYLVFAVFCVVMTIHVFFLFPETAGLPLEETNFMFEDPAGGKYIGTPAWRVRHLSPYITVIRVLTLTFRRRTITLEVYGGSPAKILRSHEKNALV